MSRLAAGGLGLIAAAAICLIGTVVDSALAGVAWSLGAWLAVLATATAYLSIAKTARRTLPAGALALLGIAASAWTVETTLRIAFPESNARRVADGNGWWADLVGVSPVPLPLLVITGSGAGLAMFAAAASRVGLVRPAVGVVVAITAVLGSITADPAAPYLLGGGPLGAALLTAGVRSRMSVGAVGTRARRTACRNADRAERTVERATRWEPRTWSAGVLAGARTVDGWAG